MYQSSANGGLRQLELALMVLRNKMNWLNVKECCPFKIVRKLKFSI
jgi:hypothetical protein